MTLMNDEHSDYLAAIDNHAKPLSWKSVICLSLFGAAAMAAIATASECTRMNLERHVFEVDYDKSDPEPEHYIIMDNRLHVFTPDNRIAPFPDRELESAIRDRFFKRERRQEYPYSFTPEEAELRRAITVTKLSDYLISR